MTKYYPFSLLFRTFNFHYRYKDTSTLYDIVFLKIIKSGLSAQIVGYDLDNYFAYVDIKIKNITDSHIKKFTKLLDQTLGNEQYVLKRNDGDAQIRVARTVLCNFPDPILAVFHK